ncbi:hypothetical protein MTX26_11105 [Bradyrhizobium sp. ISRA443]|uniref:hypothetical protein n=2 Tax=unclassified Bradyrhizobium TaxID=2631580 RepID=UPI00247AE83C|nr:MULTISPECIES: hypothetical protein [unclassified Bradyrhizobium]WGR91142.1 hypothetical protein MTX20_21490 [Bradyrhizobium sp. ISRA435]WGS01324.1 hypothetical protein MTX23_11100 [Bradyrhizobium sp. ISRA436]WGS08211.1 hypothetical protein MTX18_11105 [Bradyrhizobium sp. ISRA437]WGS15099.1 hypothetical protein MTX26_11105 [Bradyrhizobium sp. ISRA443]
MLLDNCPKVLDHQQEMDAYHKPANSCGEAMKRKREPPWLDLRASGVDDMPVASTEERLLALLATLEECQTFLVDRANAETARLLSLAILELRMELHKVTDSELKALCDMVASERQLQEPATARRFPPYLKLVK